MCVCAFMFVQSVYVEEASERAEDRYYKTTSQSATRYCTRLHTTMHDYTRLHTTTHDYTPLKYLRVDRERE